MAVKVGRFILLETIGQGSFARVKLAVDETTMRRYAVKVFDRNSIPLEDFESDIKREVKIMQYLRHNHIVTVHQVLMSSSHFYIVMELVSGGELFYEIRKHRRLDVKRARKYFQQLVDAMCYCHAKGVYHRDLKPENVLIDENDNIKITDFGMSFIHEITEADDPTENKACRTQCGTPKYMAPEVIMTSRSGYNGAKTDTWDCGLILYAMVAGFLPFNGEDDRHVFRQIVFARIKYPDWFDEDLQSLLGIMLEKDPEKRCSLEDVRKHRWFQEGYTAEAYYETSMEEVRSERRARAERGRVLNRRGSRHISRSGQSRSRSRSTAAHRQHSRTQSGKSQRNDDGYPDDGTGNDGHQASGRTNDDDSSMDLVDRFRSATALSESKHGTSPASIENQDVNVAAPMQQSVTPCADGVEND